LSCNKKTPFRALVFYLVALVGSHWNQITIDLRDWERLYQAVSMPV
jgi:hypothetical protein